MGKPFLLDNCQSRSKFRKPDCSTSLNLIRPIGKRPTMRELGNIESAQAQAQGSTGFRIGEEIANPSKGIHSGKVISAASDLLANPDL